MDSVNPIRGSQRSDMPGVDLHRETEREDSHSGPRETDKRKHGFLNSRFNEQYVPTLAEWRALELTARLNRSAPLSGKVCMTGFDCAVHDTHLHIIAEIETCGDWKAYLGNGRFSCSIRDVHATLSDAALELLNLVLPSFQDSGLNHVNLVMEFYLERRKIGRWQNGTVSVENIEAAS